VSRAPRASTRIAGVIGDPVRHSLSPVLHNAAFDALGVDWVYVAFPVPAGEAPAAIAAMRVLGIRGLSVTMPHKAGVAASVDRLTPVAGRLAAVNTVITHGGELVGDSTDGDGFLDALRLDEGWDPAGRRCLVLGAGGAARAVCLALGNAGAAEVGVVARRPEAAREAASFAGVVGLVRPVDAAADADLVVNATPVGMVPAGQGGGELPFGIDSACLGGGQLVIDLIYHPPTTPLLAAARARGATAVNGVGMLLYQAGRQVTAWTGQDAPLDAMSAALLAALAERGPSPPPGGGRDGDG
jgi:shikimate dehydrogenase